MPRPKIRNEDLKSEILVKTLDVLESEGSSAVTARRVAAEAGSSTAAVYELFGDKGGLVRAMFLDGFDRLAERLGALAEGADPRASVSDSLACTRRFAIENPALFAVMYERPFADFNPSAENTAAAKQIYAHVVDRVAAMLQTDSAAAATVDAAHALVALNRGLIANELAGLLGRSPAGVERRRALAIEALLQGLTESARADGGRS